MEISYSILDPTGNITALAETPVEPERRRQAAAAIMRLHPEVEQVGFVTPARGESLPALQMAGGEFCGNASMCAAALLADGAESLRLRVSGAAEPVTVTLRPAAEAGFQTALQMPPALSLSEREFCFEGLRGRLPLVCMEGISHLIVEESSPFFALLGDRAAAERAVRAFCAELKADGLGLLFLAGEGSERRMTPLVYIPGSGTVFWENSCASGSSAVGMLLAARSGVQTELELSEPGGTLHVKSDPASGETWLCGSVRLTAQSSL